MLTQVGSSLPGAAFACVSGGPGWWGAVGGGLDQQVCKDMDEKRVHEWTGNLS